MTMGMSGRTLLRAGVIGLGVGEQHGIAYNAAPDTVLEAVCDKDPVRLREAGDRLGVAKRHEDWRKITDDPDIDLVSICSFDDDHAEQAERAFRNGKHVMVEKPVALTRDQASRVLRAQQDSGKLISSNLILRRCPRFIELREKIRAGDYGEIFYMEGDYIHAILEKITQGWRGRMESYCVVYGGGIHLIDLMRWLIGQEISEVTGMSNKILTRGSAYPFDDSFVNLLRFEGGALAKTLTTFGPKRTKFHALNVYGTRATFINDLPNAKFFTGDRPEDESVIETAYPGMAKGDLLPDFLAAIREGREPDTGVRDVFRVMDVCFAARESVESGRSIKVSYSI